MKLRTKIIIPMILLPLLACILILPVSVYLFSEEAKTTTQNQLSDASARFENDFENKKKSLEKTKSIIISDSEFLKKFENDKSLSQISEDFIGKLDVDFITVTDNRGVIRYSTLEDINVGDSEVGNSSVDAALNGDKLTDFIAGQIPALSIQSSSPVFRDGAVQGVLVVGYRLDTVEYVDSMKELTGSEVTLLMGNKRIATTVMNANGDRAVGTTMNDDIWGIVSSGESYSGTATIEGREAIVDYRPIISAADESEVIGSYFVGVYTSEASSAINEFIIICIVAALIVVVIALITGMTISKRITKPIKKIVEAANALAKGAVDVHVDAGGSAELIELSDAFGKLMDCFKQQAYTLKAMASGDYSVDMVPTSSDDVVGNAILDMLKSNNKLLYDIRTSAEQVSRGAYQISNSSQELSSGSMEQSATIQRFEGITIDLQKQSQTTNHLADDTHRSSEKVGVLMDESIKYMNDVSAYMNNISEESRNIAKVVQLIDNIAFQTNILSLNAAVEAARAGAQGKGFSVVANEVRNLAAKSAEAVRETTELIDRSIEKMTEGVEIATRAHESVEKIAGIAETNAENMMEIKEASKRQVDIIDELTRGIGEIAKVIDANSAAAEENAAASEEMSSQSQVLEHAISHFKTRIK